MEELLVKLAIAEKNGFDLDAWMKRNFNYDGDKDGAIALLSQKERYKNLENDVEFMQLCVEKEEGGEPQ